MDNYSVLAYEVSDVQKHPNADQLDIVTIEGFECISKKGRWSVGQVAYYIPRDVVLPESLMSFIGLKDSRVRIIKLRGIRSEGLLLNLSEIENYSKQVLNELQLDELKHCIENNKNIAPILGIKKYLHPSMRRRDGKEQTDRFVPPNWTLTNYNIPNNGWLKRCLQELQEKEIHVDITEKIHGTWCQVCYTKPELNIPPIISSKGIAEQGAALLDNGNIYHTMVKNEQLVSKLENFIKDKEYDGVILLGEIYGKSIQDLTYENENIRYRAFDILVINDKKKKYLTPTQFMDACDEMNISRVPSLYVGKILPLKQIKSMSEEDSVVPKMDNGSTKSHIREGVVLRRLDGLEFVSGVQQIKFISDRYLLRANGTEDN